MPDGDPVMGPDMRVSIAQRPKITGLDGWLGGAPFVMLTSLLAAQKNGVQVRCVFGSWRTCVYIPFIMQQRTSNLLSTPQSKGLQNNMENIAFN